MELSIFLEVLLVNVWLFVQSTDHRYDLGHNSGHTKKVAEWVLQFMYLVEPVLGIRAELVLIAAALLHEQADSKFGLLLDRVGITVVLILDGFSIDEQEIVLWMISYCSFGKKGSAGRCDQRMLRYFGWMRVLCAADLAEGVGESALTRSYLYHQGRLAKKYGRLIVVDKYIWRCVYRWFNGINCADGYFNRLEGIEIPEIREKINGAVEKNKALLEEKTKMFSLEFVPDM
jgi:hypothetical protein